MNSCPGRPPSPPVGAMNSLCLSKKQGGTNQKPSFPRSRAFNNLSFLLVIIGPTTLSRGSPPPPPLQVGVVASSLKFLKVFSPKIHRATNNIKKHLEEFSQSKSHKTQNTKITWLPEAVKIIAFLPPVSADNGVAGLLRAIFLGSVCPSCQNNMFDSWGSSQYL